MADTHYKNPYVGRPLGELIRAAIATERSLSNLVALGSYLSPQESRKDVVRDDLSRIYEAIDAFDGGVPPPAQKTNKAMNFDR